MVPPEADVEGSRSYRVRVVRLLVAGECVSDGRVRWQSGSHYSWVVSVVGRLKSALVSGLCVGDVQPSSA